MELNEILSKVDHTLLAQTATWAEIKAICDDGMKYHTASVASKHLAFVVSYPFGKPMTVQMGSLSPT